MAGQWLDKLETSKYMIFVGKFDLNCMKADDGRVSVTFDCFFVADRYETNFVGYLP